MTSIAVNILSALEGPIVSYEMVPEMAVAKDEGVLLIGSGPWDSMRISWVQRQLMSNLCLLGYRVLRFDLTGTGESPEPTQAARWDRWVRESCEMRDSLRKTVGKVHVVGFRIGGTLALKASESYAFRSLHLIDPVLDGHAYWDYLNKIQQSFVVYNNRYGSNIQTTDELFGFPLDASWRSAWSDLHPGCFESKGRRAFLYSSLAQDGGLETFVKQLEHKNWDVQNLTITDDFSWHNHKKLQLQCFARETLLAITRSFGEL